MAALPQAWDVQERRKSAPQQLATGHRQAWWACSQRGLRHIRGGRCVQALSCPPSQQKPTKSLPCRPLWGLLNAVSTFRALQGLTLRCDNGLTSLRPQPFDGVLGPAVHPHELGGRPSTRLTTGFRVKTLVAMDFCGFLDQAYVLGPRGLGAKPNIEKKITRSFPGSPPVAVARALEPAEAMSVTPGREPSQGPCRAQEELGVVLHGEVPTSEGT
ncbi:hypothetical protein GW7_17854 [Heterocephalus glaber]|uniref:Uncharacterized protein n=1 Tax=Heterocephalus glaber TaxID=10181 RepID=G5AQK7_HETGA|nr:hypothetical protein GW7_17854 [Heterocephalus glaber]